MCRFIAYLGKPKIVDELVIKPINSLINQSSHAKEAIESINADGFGLGWYDKSIDPLPAVFISTLPAWNDQNLINLAKKVRSECFFAHIRAANMGDVSQFNCHPFRYDRFLFMHNGLIGGFNTIKRQLTSYLNDKCFNWIRGQTDSERLCAIFANRFYNNNRQHTVADMRLTLLETIEHVLEVKRINKISDISLINIAITDGENLVVSRFSSHPEKHCNTLYYSQGDSEDQTIKDNIIIASERLSDYNPHWHEVPVNHVISVDKDINIELTKINLTSAAQLI